MTAYQPGERVRVDIPGSDDPDYRYHGEVGTISSVFVDDLSDLTGTPEDDYLYTVVFDAPNLGEMYFRPNDLTSL